MPNLAKERERGRRRRRDAKITRLEARVAELSAVPELVHPVDVDLSDPAGVIAAWCSANLVIPTGRLTGQPFLLEEWQVDFLRDALAKDTREAALSCARKSGKSGLIAAVILCYLCGPLNQPNWRAIVVSLTGALAGELRRQITEIATASGIEELVRDYRSPTPGRIVGQQGAEVTFLASDKATGNAVSGNLTVTDESGLMPESQRGVWDAVYSCVSTRNGRNVHISIKGDGPMFAELLERKGEQGIVVHEYAAPVDCDLGSEEAWLSANPGLRRDGTGIKSWQYMVDAAERAKQSTAAAAGFRVLDLNAPGSPTGATVISWADYQRCLVAELPARDGDAWIGLDCGGASAFTSAAVYWAQTGRCELYSAIGDNPPLAERSRSDGLGPDFYPRMRDRGELWTYPQRETPVAQFVADLAQRLEGVAIGGIVSDEYRSAKLRDGLESAGLHDWLARLVIRPVRWKQSSDDIDRFQTAVITATVRFPDTMILASAVRESRLQDDKRGNVILEKNRAKGRIDVLQACVLAVSAGERNRTDPDAGSGVFGSMSA